VDRNIIPILIENFRDSTTLIIWEEGNLFASKIFHHCSYLQCVLLNFKFNLTHPYFHSSGTISTTSTPKFDTSTPFNFYNCTYNQYISYDEDWFREEDLRKVLESNAKATSVQKFSPMHLLLVLDSLFPPKTFGYRIL